MKLFLQITFLTLALLSVTTTADDSGTDNEIFAQRGKGVITQFTFAARADRIPDNKRLATLRDGNRLRDILNDLLIKAQLAEEAREAGFDQDVIVRERMRLAAEAELASAWLQNTADKKMDADFETLAFEYYQLNKDELMTQASIDVSHILISTKERPADEAKTLASTVHQQIVDDPLLFDELVGKYSEDPSASANKGKFTKVKKGDMVTQFEEVAFGLNPGEISEPVKTGFGFHIIRLDAYYPPEQLEFAAIKDRLVETARTRHEERVKRDYLDTLTSLNVDMTEDALKEMVDRIFGDDYVEPTAEGGNSE